MILLIDNYDSFTYNIVQYLGEVHPEGRKVKVVRNDKITAQEVQSLAPSHIIISPGPCSPNEAGVSCQLIAQFAGAIPILGICLGHQAIGQVFGARIVRASTPVHGKTSMIEHTGQGIFSEIPNPFQATRYHSLIIETASCPEVLEQLAWSEDGNIMAVRHRQFPSIIGLQFHPESVLTEVGRTLLARFLSIKA